MFLGFGSDSFCRRPLGFCSLARPGAGHVGLAILLRVTLGLALGLVAVLIGTFAPLTGYAEEQLPRQLKDVTIKENLGASLNLGLPFTNHEGKSVFLGDYFKDGKPVLLTLNYFQCKSLCGVQFNAIVQGLSKLDWQPGRNFRVITVSIDPRNTAQMAAEKRESLLSALGKGPEAEWEFLVGSEAAIKSLADEVGFKYRYDAATDQFAHGAALYFLTPKGNISRYLYGIEYSPSNIKFALIDASDGRVGTTIEKLILSCFHYDEVLGKYSPYAIGLMRLGGFLTTLVIATWLSILWRRDSARRRKECLS